MKVVLINPTPPGISSFGVRSISAFLRERGHDTSLIFLPGSLGRLKEGGGYSYKYSEKIIDQLTELSLDADLLGVSFFTNYLDRATQITVQLKEKLDTPVIWGGIHGSTKPQESLQFADIVCIGEGEYTLLELLSCMEEGKGWTDIKGIWFKNREGEIVKNDNRPLISNLDSLPFFDFSNKDHYIHNLKRDLIEPLSEELLEETMVFMPDITGKLLKTYRTLTDRGCPHTCSYCNVPTLKRIFQDDPNPFLRSRSPENVIEELLAIKNKYQFIEAIHIFDDTFFARSNSYLETFAHFYKKEIDLPLYCQASPNTLTPRKLEILISAGLVYVEMGIQTGSSKIRKLYSRPESNDQILKAAQLLHKHKKNLIPPDYHIILDNPWETEEDTLETVRLLHKIPKPYGLAISSLVFYPKTGLYERAIKEGLIEDEMKEISLKPFYIPPKQSYVNFLIYLMTYNLFPQFLMEILIRDKVVKLASSFNLTILYKAIYAAGELGRMIFKGARAVITGDKRRLSIYWSKVRIGDPIVAGRKGK